MNADINRVSSGAAEMFHRILGLVVIGMMMMVSGTVNAKTLVVAYAGSMGPLMDQYIGPNFARLHDVEYQGIGNGSFALARMIAAGQINPDVFVSVTPGPIRLLQKVGLVQNAVVFASTRMVLAWSPNSPLAPKFAAAKAGGVAWYNILASDGVHFGRTDPLTDPQGRATVLCLMLADQYYHQPDLASRILGPVENPAQIFSEPSLMFRLRAGQLDACVTYESSACASEIPFMPLPAEINLGDPRFEKQYTSVVMQVKDADGVMQHFQAEPLIFYSAVLKNARDPELGAAFSEYLNSSVVVPWLQTCGYTPIAAKIVGP
ncbi:MAG TPA: extracellular solute-binding protein [Phycisphaerae bacterium]|nr:extracellular solute-binding protein [Phycisphaerae bacterium]